MTPFWGSETNKYIRVPPLLREEGISSTQWSLPAYIRGRDLWCLISKFFICVAGKQVLWRSKPGRKRKRNGWWHCKLLPWLVNWVLVTFIKHAVEHEHAHYKAGESKLAYNRDLMHILRRRRGRRLVKNVFLFHFGISHLFTSIKFVGRY